MNGAVDSAIKREGLKRLEKEDFFTRGRVCMGIGGLWRKVVLFRFVSRILDFTISDSFKSTCHGLGTLIVSLANK